MAEQRRLTRLELEELCDLFAQALIYLAHRN